MRVVGAALFLAACARAVPPGAALPVGEACVPGAEPCAYPGGLLPLASGFAAKEACSCVFVAGRSEEECAAWVKVSPAVASFRVDRERKRVVAHALGTSGASATFVDEAHGCVLDLQR